MSPASPSRRVRTGVFEIDLNSGEVLKNGWKLPLQEQPFRVLAMLLERPGEVVAREELQARLWPADTYVSFDEGLNTAVRKLRVVFGDSADSPRFIETLPRRGYRFIAPVTESRGNGLSGQVSTLADTPAIGRVKTHSVEASGFAHAASSRNSTIWRWTRVVAVGGTVTVLILAWVAQLRMRPASPPANAPQQRVMLAVLPFENLSNQPDQDYFSDGLTEETITDMGEVSPEELGVIARTSAMAYKHTGKTVSQIGHELGVNYVLEGSVRREGERVRISAQLIRVKDQTHVWAREYDRKLTDLIQVQNDLGEAIAEQVRANLNSQREVELSGTQTVDPEAYDLYLKGRFYWNQRTPVSVKQSIRYFQQAVSKDPDFALAYSGLADAYNMSNIMGAYSPKDSFPQARAAALKAIQLNPRLAEAHAALGMEKSHYEFDFPGAEKEFLKAIELNPNSSYAHLFYSNCYLLPMGRKAEAIVENEKAVKLDPLSLPINDFMAMTYMFAGDYAKSYEQFQHTIAMDPDFALAHYYFSFLLTVEGRYPEAIEEHEKGQLLTGSSPKEADIEANTMLKAFQKNGERGFWQSILEQTLRAKKRGDPSVTASMIASTYAWLNDRDQAFEWLDKAYDERDGQDITLLKLDPSYRNLRGDPRFGVMLRRLGLSQ
jgi:TolB-like protein/DNA-binding winged helix-turn-helix (wHTH) protein/Tfp pilus assembly protein PilF